MYHNITLELREKVCKHCGYLSDEVPIIFGEYGHLRTIVHCMNPNMCCIIKDVRYRTTKDAYERARKMVMDPDYNGYGAQI